MAPLIQKLSGGVEDLTFGMGTENQTRQGQLVQITQINASNIPYSITQSILQKFNLVDGKIAQFDNYIVITDLALDTKADKVVGATFGNFASLDGDGNLIDSGITALNPGMQLVDNPIENNLIAMDALGDSKDAGLAITDLALVMHVHAIADVTGLQTILDGKASLVHVHTIGDVTGLQVELDGKALLVHTHVINDIAGLQTALDGKAPLVHIHAISDVTGLQTALDGKASTVHIHAISDVTGLQEALDLVPAPVFPADEGLALVARATGNDWEKILGLPLETGNAHKTVTTDGVEGDSYWSPIVTSPNVIDTDFAMSVGANGSIVSPTIDDGVTVTVPDGSTLVIL
jgi:hypothetical protein